VALDAAGNLFIGDGARIRKVALAGSPTLSFNDLNPVKAGNYRVIITSASGSVTSSVAAVNLQLPPITPAFTASNGAYQFTWGTISNLT
jgi:hypothetical protein